MISKRLEEHYLNEAFDDFSALHAAYTQAYDFIKGAIAKATQVFHKYGIQTSGTEVENLGFGGAPHNRRLTLSLNVMFTKGKAEDPQTAQLAKELDMIPGCDVDVYNGILTIINDPAHFRWKL